MIFKKLKRLMEIKETQLIIEKQKIEKLDEINARLILLSEQIKEGLFL